MRAMRYVFTVVLLFGLISNLAAQDPEAKLIVMPREVKLEPGQGQRFEAVLFSVTGTPIHIESVRWAVVPDSAGKISEDGFFVAGRREGEAKIIATAKANNRVYVGEAHVIIGNLQVPPLKIVVVPQDTIVPPGQSQQYRVHVITTTPPPPPITRVRWEVQPRNLGKISETGLFTAGSQFGQGLIIALVEIAGTFHRGETRVTVALAPSSALAGQVVDAKTGLPITRAMIWAERLGEPHWSRLGKTDSLGKYEIGKLIPGLYVVRAEARGYLPEFYKEASHFEQALPIQLPEKTTVTGIDFTLSHGATISGLVATESDSMPLAGAHVVAILVVHPERKHHAVTDADGNFSVLALPTGTYAVQAEAAGYKGEFYDNARGLVDAKLISVTEPDSVGGIEMYLATASAIAGKVTDAVSGDPIAKAVVSIHALISTRPKFMVTVPTNEKGDYIANVPPGFYLVAAEARGYHKEFYKEVRDILKATPVQVFADQHTTGIDFTLDKLGFISGNVSDQVTGKPIAGAMVTAFPERPGTNALLGVDESHRPFLAKTDSLGNYKIEGVRSGKYFVMAEARGYLREFWKEAATLDKATPIEVPATGGVENINFTLEIGGVISGTVYSAADSTPVRGAWVQVWLKGSNAALARAQTARDGKYRIAGLLTGDYLVSADAEGFKRIFYKDAESRDKATPVHVEAPKETSGIDMYMKKIDTRGGTIAGVVVSEADKTPIPHALVLAIPLPSLLPVQIPTLFTITDEFGRYKLSGLMPGQYVALACAPRFLCEFYDNAKTFREAKVLTLASGTVLDGINFSLTPAQHGPYLISGRVRHGRENRGAGNTVVQAVESTVIVGTAVTEDDGSFTLDEMPAGEYKIYATGPSGSGYYGGETEQNAISVAVGNGQNVGNIELTLPDVSTGVDDSQTLPTQFVLEPNYPNPFNPETSIKYQLPVRAHVTLRIFNALGQEVRTLVNQVQEAGKYAVQWDGKDHAGHQLATGIYLMRFEAGDIVMTRKMAMVK